jgi:hypothetical protein
MNNQIHSPSEQGGPTGQSTLQIDQFDLENYFRKLKSEQNLVFGFFGGLVGVTIGAILWAAITTLTDYQIGWMAVGVGFLVGISVRFAGQGLNVSFGIMGGFLALVGCLLGNFLAIIIIVSQEFEVSLLQVLINLDLEIMVELIAATFSPIDLLFYALATYMGYRYSFRTISKDDLARWVR